MELWGFRKRQSRRTGCAVRTRFRWQIERAALWAARFVLISWSLQQLHVLCLPAFGAFDDVELHGLTFFQASEPVCLDCGKVNKHILSVLPADKAIPFRVIEPLNCSLFHCVTRIPCFFEICAFLKVVQAGCSRKCRTASQTLGNSQAHYTQRVQSCLYENALRSGQALALCYFLRGQANDCRHWS